MSKIEKNGSAVKVIPAEDIVSATRDGLKDELLQLISEGAVQVTIDLQNVTKIDSTGLSVFIAAYNTLKEKEGVLELINVNETIKKLLTLTRLDRYVAIVSK